MTSLVFRIFHGLQNKIFNSANPILGAFEVLVKQM